MKPRGSCDNQTSKQIDNKTLPTKSSLKPSNRARWGDPKRSRDMRKTCPVNLKDLININHRKSVKVEDPDVTMSTVCDPIQSPEPNGRQTSENFDNIFSNKDEKKPEGAKLKDRSISYSEKPSIDPNQLINALSKDASFDLSTRSKEHVIDEIEEVLSLSSRGESNSEVFPSSLEDMFRFLSNQSQVSNSQTNRF